LKRFLVFAILLFFIFGCQSREEKAARKYLSRTFDIVNALSDVRNQFVTIENYRTQTNQILHNAYFSAGLRLSSDSEEIQQAKSLMRLLKTAAWTIQVQVEYFEKDINNIDPESAEIEQIHKQLKDIIMQCKDLSAYYYGFYIDLNKEIWYVLYNTVNCPYDVGSVRNSVQSLENSIAGLKKKYNILDNEIKKGKK